ncbi:MAG: DUF4410 domain-containing protein [Nitrospirales bacterium]|nr:DUF4410 domain-containing protein [Nitrospira sp.]MDR4461885.1 DUF4410 domain-containing protein [Nitrospirales bacterium]MDR4483907.1 DUF4410 domain-containing protein [Nitrospirales bacterium]MDR4485809.1 DUF4410 domain-containing protein [Nitrospirales bacterium]
MKHLTRIVSCVLVLALAIGCASTKITKSESKIGAQKIPKPDRMYVFPFAATHADLPSWSASAKAFTPPSSPPSPENLEAGRKLGGAVAKELVTKIQEMGLVALEGDKHTVPRINDLMFVGYFTSVEEGSTLKRMTLGFGSGNAEVKTAMEAYQMTKSGPRVLGSGELEAGGGKMPGMILPVVVFAATANPIGLIVGGAAKVTGEATGHDTIEGEGKRTAEAIAERLQIKFREQGWIR